MNKIVKTCALALALSFPVMGSSSTLATNVSYAAADRINLGINTGNTTYQELELTLNQNEELRQASLAKIKEIRGRMWDENIPYTLEDGANSKGERLQDVAKAHGYNSRDAYVNGISWSTELEKVAIQRAYEQTIKYDHYRPDGSDFYTAKTASGAYPSGENLASSTALQSPTQAFGQWSFSPSKNKGNKSEYDLLKEANGVSNSYNGHLHNILDPEFKHFAFAVVNNTGTKWNYAAQEFAYALTNNSEVSLNLNGAYRLYVGTPTKEDLKPTPAPTPAPAEDTNNPKESREETLIRLADTVEKAETTISAARFLMNKMPNFKAAHGPELEAIIKDQQNLIAQANKLLGR